MKLLTALYAMLTADKWTVIVVKDNTAEIFRNGNVIVGKLKNAKSTVREVNEILGN